MRLPLAVVFAMIWFGLYAGAKMPLFGGAFGTRYFEIVIATLGHRAR